MIQPLNIPLNIDSACTNQKAKKHINYIYDNHIKYSVAPPTFMLPLDSYIKEITTEANPICEVALTCNNEFQYVVIRLTEECLVYLSRSIEKGSL